MKPSETSALYVEAARSKRLIPQEEEGRLWHKAFASYAVKDVRAALDFWFSDTTPGKDGEPRGKWLPSPAELKPIVERMVRDRENAAAVKRYLVRWYCSACRHLMSGYLAPGDSTNRSCPSLTAPNARAGQKCGNPMTVLLDERPRA